MVEKVLQTELTIDEMKIWDKHEAYSTNLFYILPLPSASMITIIIIYQNNNSNS
jgi:hypothetical protein